MKKYLIAFALSLLPMSSQASMSARVAGFACALYAAPLLAVGLAAARTASHELKEQPIYFKSGPSIFGDDENLLGRLCLDDESKERIRFCIVVASPQKPAVTPYDVAEQMVIHHNSI